MREELRRQCTVRPLVIPEVVTFPPEVDISNGEGLGADLLAAFRPGVAVVIADLSQTVFCDSTGIRYLLVASNHAVSTGAQLRVVVGGSAVRRALRVLGADQTLALYADMQAALTGAGIPRASPL